MRFRIYIHIHIKIIKKLTTLPNKLYRSEANWEKLQAEMVELSTPRC